METNKYTDLKQKINIWNSQCNKGMLFNIPEEAVGEAVQLVKRFENNSKDKLLALLCSLNLLNAAIKMPEYKQRLEYGFIKKHAEMLIEAIDTLKDKSVSYYYNRKERCLYFNFEKIIFSFHEVPLTSHVLKASIALPIKWGGIRLQKIANPIFSFITKIY